MGKFYPAIDLTIRQWIERQHMFFVGTAPLSGGGSVNISPKGHDTLRVLDDHTLAFLDYGGSGIETIAHLRENGRIVIMMCAFDGPPKVYRFHGVGEVVTPLDKEFDALAGHFDRSVLGIRAVIRIRVTKISDSCGFGVPLYQYQKQRDTSPNYIRVNGIEKIRIYLQTENQESIDGLPGQSGKEIDSYQGPAGSEVTDPTHPKK
ncbi:MAG: pyridoxamine 5'-phosphate oxidase family protein [Gammaproteobacteria bacterium]